VLVNLFVAESTDLGVPSAARRPCRRGCAAQSSQQPDVSQVLGGVGSIAVRGGDVSKQVPRILLADDLKLGQGNEESLANAKGRHAIGFIETGMFWGRYPFDSNLTRQGNIRALIHISEAG
jgi:hypothetical protein